MTSGIVQKEKSVRSLLYTMTKKVDAVLPTSLESGRLFGSVLTAFRKNPSLFDCSHESVMLAVMQAAYAGWEVDGPHAKASLVPFKGECTLIASYRGLIDSMVNSGDVSNVTAQAVYDLDDFDINLGSGEPPTHRPYLRGDRGHLIGVYAVVRFKDGTTKTDYMSTPEVDRIKARSPSVKNGGFTPWKSDYDEMAKKTIVRRISKQCPFSSEDRRSMVSEAEAAEAVAPDERVVELRGVRDAKTQEPQRVLPADDPQRGELLKQIKHIELDHPEAFATAMQGAPPLDEQEVSGLRMTLKAITAAVPQTAGKGD